MHGVMKAKPMALPQMKILFKALCLAGILLLCNVVEAQLFDGSEHIVIDFSFRAYEAASVYATDIDGDGDLDVLSASQGEHKITWFENVGNPIFKAHIISTNAKDAMDVYAADMDGDGDMDVLSASWRDNKIAWYENDGNQNFSENVISLNADGAYSVYASDVDGDGDMDVLSASSLDNKIAWYENDGNQNFSENVISLNANSARSVYAADMDGDGDMDVLSASSLDNKIAWYQNDGDQIFTDYVLSISPFGLRSVYAIDVDKDGDMDVLSASSLDNKIAWYENDGNQGFTYHVISLNAYYAKDVYATDVDGDGDIDVLSASLGDDKIAWYENDGNQSFTERAIDLTVNEASSVYAMDIDNDGDMDVLSASFGDHKIAWYENDGNQNFSSHVIAASASGASSVFAFDIDMDGDVDVLSSSEYDDKIAWYENDGNQVFLPHTISTNAIIAASVHASDVDGDGDIDVLSASRGDHKVAWYENDGNQNFKEHPISIDTYEAISVYTSDLDEDGDIDVLVAGRSSNKIVWFENDGNEDFVTHNISVNAHGGQSVYAEDVDGDGDMDVLSASSDYDKISWYENQLINIDLLAGPDTVICDAYRINSLSGVTNDTEAYWWSNTPGVVFADSSVLNTSVTVPDFGSYTFYLQSIDNPNQIDSVVVTFREIYNRNLDTLYACPENGDVLIPDYTLSGTYQVWNALDSLTFTDSISGAFLPVQSQPFTTSFIRHSGPEGTCTVTDTFEIANGQLDIQYTHRTCSDGRFFIDLDLGLFSFRSDNLFKVVFGDSANAADSLLVSASTENLEVMPWYDQNQDRFYLPLWVDNGLCSDSMWVVFPKSCNCQSRVPQLTAAGYQRSVFDCANDSLFFAPEEAPFLFNGDSLFALLYTDPNDPIGSQLALKKTSATGGFFQVLPAHNQFDSLYLSLGVARFVSDAFDFSKCLDFSSAAVYSIDPVIHELYAVNDNVCRNAQAAFVFTNGSKYSGGEVNITWTDEINQIPFARTVAPGSADTLWLDATGPVDQIVVSVSDIQGNQCINQLTNTADSAAIRPNVELSIDGGGVFCNSDSVIYRLKVDPTDAYISGNPFQHIWTTENNLVKQISLSDFGTFDVIRPFDDSLLVSLDSSAYDCASVLPSESEFNSIDNDLAMTYTIPQGHILCDSNMVYVECTFSGLAPYTFIYAVNGLRDTVVVDDPLYTLQLNLDDFPGSGKYTWEPLELISVPCTRLFFSAKEIFHSATSIDLAMVTPATDSLYACSEVAPNLVFNLGISGLGSNDSLQLTFSHLESGNDLVVTGYIGGAIMLPYTMIEGVNTIRLKAITNSHGCAIEGPQWERVVFHRPVTLSIDVLKNACAEGSKGILGFDIHSGKNHIDWVLTDNNNVTQMVLDSGFVGGLDIGNHHTIVGYNNQCQIHFDDSIFQASPFSVQLITGELQCFDNQYTTIEVDAESDDSSQQYLVDINGSIHKTLPASQLSGAGPYQVVVTETRSKCFQTFTGQIDLPADFDLSIIPTNESCPDVQDGGFTLGTSNPDAPFTLRVWNDTLDYDSTVTGDGSGFNYSGLSGGVYQFVIENDNGCKRQGQVMIDAPQKVPYQMEKLKDADCQSDGAFRILIQDAVTVKINGDITEQKEFLNLQPGEYVVQVTKGGCTMGIDTVHIERVSPSFGVDLIQQPTCYNTRDAVLKIYGINTPGPFKHSLNGENFVDGDTFSTGGGIQSFVVYEDYCQTYDTINIQVPVPDSVLSEANILEEIQCNGHRNGKVQVNATGGIAPFVYRFAGDWRENNVYDLLYAGSYTYQVMDANGCLSDLETVVLNEPEALILQTNAVFDAQRDSFDVQLLAAGGEPPYDYSMDGLSYRQDSVVALPEGIYTFFVRDRNGCITTISQSLEYTSVVQIKSSSQDFNVFPNPYTQAITLECERCFGGNFQVQIVDDVGRTIYDETGSWDQIKKQAELELTGLHPGHYHILLAGKNIRARESLIKQ